MSAFDFFASKFKNLLDLPSELPVTYRPRPYRNAAVRFRDCSIGDFERRRQLLEEGGLNVFLFPSRDIPGCDLLSDSGTTTMTMDQWSQLLLGDEAYGSNEGYFDLVEQIPETFGPAWRQISPGAPNLFIFHQGRAAEHALFTILTRLLSKDLSERACSPPILPLPAGLEPALRATIKKKVEIVRRRSLAGQPPYFIIPSNSHFDTTEANVESNSMVALNLPCVEHLAKDGRFPFRGNIDLERLEALLAQVGDRVPLVYLTITNNTGGGQPVSISNMKRAKEIASRHGIPLLFDACRFAENAWFIRQNERGYRRMSIQEIVHLMFTYADGFHISLKKDGLVNMGGAVVIKEDSVFAKRYPAFREMLTAHQILVEGHPTYGGLAGRDLKGIVEGLKTVVRKEYLDHRIGQVERFGRRLKDYGIPVMTPIGGHAVYLDMDAFFEGTRAKDEDFKGISFAALMLLAGHRLCELGIYAFGRNQDGVEIPPEPRVNNVRAAVPRLAYEDQDLSAVVEAVKVLRDHRDRIPGVVVEYGQDLPLRHFKSRFRFKGTR